MGNPQDIQVAIRRMSRDDIDSIINLTRKFAGGSSSITYRDMAATDPGGPLDLSFVALVGGWLAGFIIARLAYVYIPFTEICLMHGIVVDPDYQRHHIGSRLVNELLNQCQLEDIYTVRALVNERDSDIKRFIEGLGFQRSRIINYDKTFEN
jgi:N-acetylglutamate synthase-like GNAT family acetyltransferase